MVKKVLFLLLISTLLLVSFSIFASSYTAYSCMHYHDDCRDDCQDDCEDEYDDCYDDCDSFDHDCKEECEDVAQIIRQIGIKVEVIAE
jgi:hypothetical protein